MPKAYCPAREAVVSGQSTGGATIHCRECGVELETIAEKAEGSCVYNVHETV